MKRIYVLSCIIYSVSSNVLEDMLQNVQDLRVNYKKSFGEVKRGFDRWDFETEKALAYPNGDKIKLAHIANLWCDYYECTARLAAKLTNARNLPSIVLRVYEGSTSRLQCALCIAPDETKALSWLFSKSVKNLTYASLNVEHRLVNEIDGNLTIYNTRASDDGVYACKIGKSVSGIIILEVVEDENYFTVKPPTSPGPYARPSKTMGELEIFSSWSQWSECSRCGRIGFRRRYGVCYVKPHLLNKIYVNGAQTNNDFILDNASITLFEDFPDGVPCRSRYLTAPIRALSAVKERRNEIMIGMCKVKCEYDKDTKVHSRSQAPLPIRTIVFATVGQKVVLRCPGTTLRDIPVLWRVGTKQVLPNNILKNTQRIHTDERDRLIINEIKYSDDNLYSCWQRCKLAGTVKVVVWSGPSPYWNRYTALLALVVIAALVLRYSEHTLRNTQRRLGIS